MNLSVGLLRVNREVDGMVIPLTIQRPKTAQTGVTDMPRFSIPTGEPESRSFENDPHDFCMDCYSTALSMAEGKYPHVDDNVDHPNYDGDDYTCERCNCRLTEEDN